MADLAKLVVRLEAQSAQLLTELEKANRRIDRFASQTAKTLQKWSGGLLAAFSVSALVQFGARTLQAADELGDFAKQAGVSVESISRLGYAAGQSGSDLQSLNQGLGILSKNAVAAASGSKEQAAAFEAMGISAKRANGSIKGTDDLLLEIADSFAKHADGAEKSALAQALFGKSGKELIPLLNQGAAGIEELGARADALGITVSTQTQQAADELNDTLATMGAVVQGVVARALGEVAPIFTNFANSQLDAAAGSERLDKAARILATGMKLLFSAGVVVTEVFDRFGDAIGAVAAAAVAAFKGNFREAAGILDDLDARSIESGQQAADDLYAIWQEAGEKIATSVEDTAKDLDKPTFKIVDKDAEKSIETAIKKLKEMSEGLAEQVETFGKGEAAATAYRLTLGKLADDVAKAGAEGKTLAATIIEQATALERLQNQEAIKNIDAQILELTGHTVESAGAMYDLANATLKASLQATNDQAGLKSLETLRQLTVAQAEYNKLELESQKIKEELARTEEQIQHSQQVGAINELEALKQLDAARVQTVERLQEIADKQAVIATDSGNAELVRDAEKANEEIVKLGQQTNLFRQKVRSDIESVAADEFGAFLSGTKSASDAMNDLINDITAQAIKFLAQDAIRRFFNFLGGDGQNGGGGGFLDKGLSFIGGLFGGSRDSGGRGVPGMAYAIGTGAQPEVYVPDQPGTFIPAHQFSGGGGVEQNIYVAGRIDARTSRQLEIEAARRQRIAQSRLG